MTYEPLPPPERVRLLSRARDVGELWIGAPHPPSTYEHRFFEPYFDQTTWTVTVRWNSSNVIEVLAYEWSQDRARAVARRIVNEMLEEAAA
jgi:hypothetical protein